MSIARVLIGLSLLMLTACASSPKPANTIPEGDFRDRIQTQGKGDVRVSTGVPSAQESKELFGISLYKKGIQPVWLKIENKRSSFVTFLPVGLDPHYFTPLEVANLDLKERKGISAETPEIMVGFHNLIQYNFSQLCKKQIWFDKTSLL